MNYTGIQNIGEFYSRHYLETLLEKDLRGLFAQWREDDDSTPDQRLNRCAADFFAAKQRALGQRHPVDRYPASHKLQAMAEGGEIAGLAADVSAINGTFVENPAGGLLAPGASTSTSLNTDAAPGNTRLSLVAMVLPSNDGFAGLNAIAIPTAPGTYTFNVNAYDAGTEGNDEIVGSGAPGEPGYPAPPPVLAASGTGGTGINASSEGYVHIHRNVLGDDNMTGGASDIVNTVHRWLNPVIRVVVTVSN